MARRITPDMSFLSGTINLLAGTRANKMSSDHEARRMAPKEVIR
jgi:hypothetical protein